MEIQLRCSCYGRHHHHLMIAAPSSCLSPPPISLCSSFQFRKKLSDNSIKQYNNAINEFQRNHGLLSNGRRRGVIVAGSNVGAPLWESWKPDKGAASPSLSDVLWPSAGAFAAMALLGKVDQMLAPKGISMTVAPLGAVCAVLFATPSSSAARKYNVFMSQIGCAAIGVLALSVFGPGWLARSAALAASIAFMIYTRSTHPPAASLPIMFIDGAKLHHLQFWYALFPGAAACIILCFIMSSIPTTNISFEDAEESVANWNGDQEAIFIELMVDEVKKGNRLMTTFKKCGWKKIREEFYIMNLS